MRSTLRVENYQPVPLTELADVEAAMGGEPGAVYLKFPAAEGWAAVEERWFHYEPRECLAFPLEGPHEAFLILDDDESRRAILARRLQPGERLVIVLEG